MGNFEFSEDLTITPADTTKDLTIVTSEDLKIPKIEWVDSVKKYFNIAHEAGVLYFVGEGEG